MDAAALASAIGARVKHERQGRHWTLDRLAEAAEVSRRMVVNVEQGAANPSVGSLLRISDALGVGLPALVEPPQRTRVRVTRRGRGAALWRSESGGRGVLVVGTEPPDVVELWTGLCNRGTVTSARRTRTAPRNSCTSRTARSRSRSRTSRSPSTPATRSPSPGTWRTPTRIRAPSRRVSPWPSSSQGWARPPARRPSVGQQHSAVVGADLASPLDSPKDP